MKVRLCHSERSEESFSVVRIKILHYFQDDKGFHSNSHAGAPAQKMMKLVGANSVRP
jgi:hypothetical protein